MKRCREEEGGGGEDQCRIMWRNNIGVALPRSYTGRMWCNSVGFVLVTDSDLYGTPGPAVGTMKRRTVVAEIDLLTSRFCPCVIRPISL